LASSQGPSSRHPFFPLWRPFDRAWRVFAPFLGRIAGLIMPSILAIIDAMLPRNILNVHGPSPVQDSTVNAIRKPITLIRIKTDWCFRLGNKCADTRKFVLRHYPMGVY